MIEYVMSQIPSERDRNWKEFAACLNRDPRLWTLSDAFEDRFVNKQHFEEAEKICAVCPVFDNCWSDATDDDKAVTMRSGAWPTEYREPRMQPDGSDVMPSKKTCKHGHDTTEVDSRYPNGDCKECKKKRNREAAEAKRQLHS